MPINVEFVAQLLDSAAFVFVTPEFLGEEKLTSIRQHLIRLINLALSTKLITKKIVEREARTGMVVTRRQIFRNCIIGFVFSGIFSSAFLLSIAKSGIIHVPKSALDLFFLYIVLFFPVIYGAVAILLLFTVMTFIVANFAVRRMVFIVGVLLFFLSRGLLAWHAWQT
jgi:hypothetical protein